MVARPRLVVDDLVHVAEELEHVARRIAQIPEDVRPEIVTTHASNARIGALGHHRPPGQADGVDVVDFYRVMVEVRRGSRLDHEVVMIGFDAHESGDTVEDGIGNTEIGRAHV